MSVEKQVTYVPVRVLQYVFISLTLMSERMNKDTTFVPLAVSLKTQLLLTVCGRCKIIAGIGSVSFNENPKKDFHGNPRKDSSHKDCLH